MKKKLSITYTITAWRGSRIDGSHVVNSKDFFDELCIYISLQVSLCPVTNTTPLSDKFLSP